MKTLLVVGLIALFVTKSEGLFEYCVNNNCTETGTICQQGGSTCICDEVTYYQTDSDTCALKAALDESCPTSYVNTQTPCLDLNAECEFDGSDYKCTCSTGFSANDTGQCMQVTDCGPLRDGVNYTISAPSTTEGGVATYTCKIGYTVGETSVTTVTRTCTDGSWTGTEPNCTPVDCGFLETLNKGETSYYPDTRYQAIATQTCLIGYFFTDDPSATEYTRQCTASGTWSGAAQTCTKVDCGNLGQLNHGVITYTPDTKYGAIATYTCYTGYGSSGQKTRTCRSDGHWSGYAIACFRLNCGLLSKPNNGLVTYDPDTRYQAVSTYTCNIGYIITGTSSTTYTRQCTASGKWDGNVPTCSERGAEPLGGTCTNSALVVLLSAEVCSGDNVVCLQRTNTSQDYTCQCDTEYYDDNGNDPAGQCKPVSELAVQDITFQSLTSSSLRVTWSPPTNMANFISGYIVEWRQKGGNVVVSTSQIVFSTFFDITRNVIPGAAYIVTVISRNQVSYSDAVKTASNQKGHALKPATPGPIKTELCNFDVENDKTMDIVWTASTGTVLYYEVALYEVNSQDFVLATTTTYTESTSLSYAQIMNGHRYDVTITAVSQNYESTNRTRSEIYRQQIETDVQVPTPPRTVECVMTTDSTVTITWQTPLTPNGELVQYKVDTYELNNPTRLQTENTGDVDLEFVVTGLQPNSYYYFNVSAINKLYTSAASRLTEKYCNTKNASLEDPEVNKNEATSQIIIVVAVVVPIFFIVVAAIVFIICKRRYPSCIVQKNKSSPRRMQKPKKNNESDITSTSQSYDLTSEMSDQGVNEWLRVHGFEQCQSQLKGFTGMDMLKLSKKDLTQICGAADGIRIYNRMKESASTREVTDGSEQPGNLQTDLDDTNLAGVPYEYIDMDRPDTYSALQNI